MQRETGDPKRKTGRAARFIFRSKQGPASTDFPGRMDIIHQITIMVLKPGADADEYIPHPGQRSSIEGVVPELATRPPGLVQLRDFAPDCLTGGLLFLISVDEIKHRLSLSP
jgi:hypothetical protein